MNVVAKLGLLEDRGRVRTDEGTFEVHPSEVDGYVVEAPTGKEPGLVRYDSEYQVLRIDRPEVTLAISFRPEAEHTTFLLNGRSYEVAPMGSGEILFTEEKRPVVRGHLTTSGAHLEFVAREFVPIVRELAFGLALRGAYGEERFWRRE